jgi:hypothetical protein
VRADLDRDGVGLIPNVHVYFVFGCHVRLLGRRWYDFFVRGFQPDGPDRAGVVYENYENRL